MNKFVNSVKTKLHENGLVFMLGLGGLFGFYFGIGALNTTPKVEGQSPVVKIERALGFSCSWGYDLDKDGKLDYAKQWVCAGRAGTVSMNVDRDSLEFKALQDKYSNK